MPSPKVTVEHSWFAAGYPGRRLSAFMLQFGDRLQGSAGFSWLRFTSRSRLKPALPSAIRRFDTSSDSRAITLARIFLTSLLSLPTFATPIQFTFTHLHGEQPLIFDSLRYQNAVDEHLSSTRLSYLISGVSLQSEQGEWECSNAIGFIDPVRGRTSFTLTQIPPGTYQAVAFHVGLDPEHNHADPARYTANHPLNPTRNNLHWDWQGGYIFMALEGHWRPQGAKLPGGYAYHFANDANRTRVTLTTRFKIEDGAEIIIGLNLAQLLKGLSFEKDGATTHSHAGDPVADRIRQNLPGAFRVMQIRMANQVPQQQEVGPIDLPATPTAYPITLPRHIPIPKLPLDNPLLKERVELGEKLFHEPALSRTKAISCASCHHGETLSDPRTFSLGVDGRVGNRHSMPLFNLAWKERFFWDGRAPSLRAQTLMPMEDHREMDESLDKVAAKLSTDPAYPQLFEAAFGSGNITPENISLALENFLLTRLSLDSKLDRSMQGKTTLSEEEQRGFELFFTESEPRLGRHGADCFHCHGGALFTDHSFHNNGLTPTEDVGLEGTTGKASDRYKFSTPSLRNVALTAPYMHDGRFATLEEVIDHYNTPFEKSATLDPNLAKHPAGLNLSEADQKALIAFLKTLSDPAMDQP